MVDWRRSPRQEEFAVSRYILRYCDGGTPPASDVDRRHGMPGLSIIDSTSPKLFLIEATETAIRKLRELPSWTITPEVQVPLPDTRKKIRQSF